MTPYPSLKELIEEGVAQIKKKNKVEVEIDEEKDIEESKKSDTESVQEMEQEPRYKIINHLTFMVEEIWSRIQTIGHICVKQRKDIANICSNRAKRLMIVHGPTKDSQKYLQVSLIATSE